VQEEKGGGRSYSVAEAEADLAAYRALKKSASVRSLAIAAVVALLAFHWLLVPALALAVGGLCGVLNTLLTTVTTERLVDSRNVGLFVLSSFLRIGLFGIVPVAFAAHGPWWSMAWYFAGFFLPLALFAAGAKHGAQTHRAKLDGGA
jgi:hypothetical protein